MKYLRSLTAPARVLAFLLALLTLSRLTLMAWYWHRVSATGGNAFILLQGIRFDFVLLGMLLGPAFLFAPWLSGRRFGGVLLRAYLLAVVVFCVFVEAGTIPFINEYDARPNYLYIEYLQYAHEVFATLIGAYKAWIAAALAATAAAGMIGWRLSRPATLAGYRTPLPAALLLTPLIAFLTLAAVRSTTAHRPVNPSTVAFSTDSMVNQLPLNSPYSLLYAIYEEHRDNSAGKASYGQMDASKVLDTVVADAGLENAVDRNAGAPTMHMHKATRHFKRPLNLVIVLEESLGAEFVGSLGGKNLTPRLDALAKEGIWLEQMYATGTRSVRGIEAVIAGFPPTVKRSVVKLAETQTHFFTIADLLRSRGYETSFIYGGEAHFDNMRRFFMNNGFQTVIDENDYPNPQYRGSWGVSDEDLFARAQQVFSQAGDTPFFSLVFTSSNHEPFDIPAGKVETETGPFGRRDTAVRYADYALGKFFDAARVSDYYAHTVFLIVADHNSRVYGNQLVPIERFHIPALILGGSIKPRRISGISSQMDLLPTLMSLIGVSGRIPAIGYDLTRPEYAQGAGRAQMQFNSIQAWMVPGKVVVLRPNLPPQSFLYRPGEKLRPDPKPDRALQRDALAHALWPSLMIKNKAYHP
ncbi:MAG: LTA synthase family protein [Lysobacterales bacterium]|jgi:phosphoglycerol transferase MdoB-like AlkP superfamily enzyme